MLDFQNDVDTIETAFARLLPDDDPQRGDRPEQAPRPQGRPRRATRSTTPTQVDQFVELYLTGADRDQLDIILDACVATYVEALDEDGQVDFKGKCKAFVRTYGFLAAILPYTNADWEKLSIFLNFLIPKLPAPKEEDLSKGILETIDMDSYRAEKSAAMKIQLADEDAEIEPVPTSGGGYDGRAGARAALEHPQDLQRDVRQHPLGRRRSDRAARVGGDPGEGRRRQAYQNAQANSDKQNARIEHDKALGRVMNGAAQGRH